MNSPEAIPAKQPPVGIDLGTTFSLLAYLDSEGRPTTVINRSGDLLTPSAVFCDDDGIVVGKEAVRSAALAPDSYAECFKRDMGSPFCHAKLRGQDVPPEVLSALVLDSLRSDAERRLGALRQVVITVPAFFDETRRRATQEAGRLANLDVLDIINEPTAAALAYGYQQGFLRLGQSETAGERMRVLIYDLGGGTFDVTILEIQGSRFQALATDGDVWLGGKDFDQRLINYLAEQFVATHGVDPRGDAQDAAQLWLDAQDLKHALSERSKATAVCFHAGIRMRIEVTRAKFESLVQDLIERTETTTTLVVKQAGLNWSQIDRVLLVGGSSRIPAIAPMLRRVTGKDPDCSQSPDEAVAHGAALYAGVLMEHPSRHGKASYELVNVNSHSLGVIGLHPKTRQPTNVVLIPKNSPLPCRATRKFRTAKGDQRRVVVSVVEGESDRPDACIPLGKCIIPDLPAGLPKGSAVDVEYRYAANGRLSVLARLPSVRYSRQIEIQHELQRSLGDLDSWIARLRGMAVPPAAPPAADGAGSPDANDRPAMQKRLDALYLVAGQAALSVPLAEPLVAGQQGARHALEEFQRAEAALSQAEEACRQTPSGPQQTAAESRLSQAKTELQEAAQRRDFSLVVLGRDCLAAGCQFPGIARQTQEIRRLQQRLAD